jgi:orotidine-5'-phosphate decarboxylase
MAGERPNQRPRNPGDESMSKPFTDRLNAAAARAGSLVCVGLDPDLSKFPQRFREMEPGAAIFEFNRAIVEATKDLVCAYKPNLGFYAAYGLSGLQALVRTRESIPADIPVILDCKVGDIGSTAAAYARGYFDEWGFDAVTANPYLGRDSLEPFLSYGDRGVIVLCKTSNPGSGDMQDLQVSDGEEHGTLFEALARRAAAWDAAYPAAVGLVVGATWPDQLARVREIAPGLPVLLPGVGAQAGDVDAALRAGLDGDRRGLIVTSSRAITYASNGDDFADAARAAAQTLRTTIETARSAIA